MEDEGGSGLAVLAIVLAVVGWVAFVTAFVFADDPWPYLTLGFVAGGASFGLAMWLRRRGTAAAGASAAAAAGGLAYALTLASLLTMALYATGVLVALILFAFLVMLMAGGWGASSSPDPCCLDCGCSACCDCGGACCAVGDCCGDCGGCGGCGGCLCAGLGIATHAGAPLATLVPHLAHHPDAPEYEADVYRVRGARLCVGCFTTYPVFVVAAFALSFASMPWTALLAAGGALALAQLVSSAGRARTRGVKAAVKTSLGLGLAALVWGVHGAPWPVAWKLGALLVLLAAAFASAIPRARRMRRAGATCSACAEGAPAPRP